MKMHCNVQSEKPKVLLVDDDESLLRLISLRLEGNNYDVMAVDSAETALHKLGKYNPDVVVTDLLMPGMDGMSLFEEIQRKTARLPVIVLTANGTIPDAVEATHKGVFSYLVKPFNAEILLKNLDKALQQTGFPRGGNGESSAAKWRDDIITRSPVMENLLQQAKAAAETEVNILIQSQTGTGKELLADAIHRASNRAGNRFIPLNCAAIPEALIESELFGHSAGSFTGATRDRKGLFVAADKGTLFLDEIGDMPLSAQAKLLRVLEYREVRPVGSTDSVRVDVRIIAATHQNLEEKIAEGSFREDLFYRLNVISLELPALKDRPEDILLLAEHFCKGIAERHGKAEVNRFSPDAAEMLVSAPWPGNVRQLYNVVEQCVVMSTTRIIPKSLVERALRFKPDKLMSLNDAREQFERDYLIRLLNLTQGNITLASRLAARNRTEFYNLLHRHRLEPAEFRK